MDNDAPSEHIDAKGLRLASGLLLIGVVTSALSGIFHAEGADANDHPNVFKVYAASQSWTAVHLGQFIGMAVITSGLLALHFATPARDGLGLWLNRFALLSAGVALALYGVLQAVDGVGLKHAVDAWASAGNADKTARFDAAETVRWLEWAVRSYHSFMFGLALILFGVVIALIRPVPRWIGYLMSTSGLCYLVQGWIIGTNGFSSANQIPTLLGIVLVAAWTVWLLISALRLPTTGRDDAAPSLL
jgi:hypothetical protein